MYGRGLCLESSQAILGQKGALSELVKTERHCGLVSIAKTQRAQINVDFRCFGGSDVDARAAM